MDLGNIEQPTPTLGFGDLQGGALGNMLQLAFNVLIIVAGIYALFNFILAGYSFLAAGDNPKMVEQGWAKIYQSVIGLLVAAGSLVLAAIFSQIIFGDPFFLLKPSIPTPNLG